MNSALPTRTPRQPRGPRRPRNARTMLAATVLGALSGPAVADVVTDVNATAEQVVAGFGGSPGIQYALVHLAVYDAVNAIERRFEPYAVTPSSPTIGASKDAAALAAARAVLRVLYPAPDAAAIYEGQLGALLAALPNGAPKAAGIALGEEVATKLLQIRANDGRAQINAPYAFRAPDPGVYRRTLPGPPFPVLAGQGNVKPFAIESVLRYRPYGPPDLTSARYTRDFAEAKAMGSATSTVRTPEQTEIARFYFEGPATFWTHNYRALVEQRHLGTGDAARLWAMLMTSYADASIACWDAKYHFNSWRPITAIQNADVDGNPYTEKDAAWQPLSPTPPHPEYPSAHSCMTSALARATRGFFGTDYVPMTLTSTTSPMARFFFRLSDQNREVIDARVWGGFHFRNASEAGIELGDAVGRYVSRYYFRPLRDGRWRDRDDD